MLLRQIKFLVLRVYYHVIDGIAVLCGKRNRFIPPRSLAVPLYSKQIMRYEEQGNEILGSVKDMTGLRPGERVLEVGSGIGRLAFALTKYLDVSGSYDGLEVYKKGVDWCRNNLTKRYANFRFHHIDVFNKFYNPSGKYKASEYKMPFEDNNFDVVFLVSVFTHMLPEDMENYLSEISRVLKKGGRCFVTYFLITAETIDLMNAGKSLRNFKFDYGIYRALDKESHERMLAYDERYIFTLYKKHSLELRGPVKYGPWRGREKARRGQDVLVASRV